jgi:hypothetical protein
MRRTLALLLLAALVGPAAGDGESSLESAEEQEDPSKVNAPDSAKNKPARSDVDEGAPVVERSLQQRINEAIRRGVEWLKKKQAQDGSWGPCHANARYGGERVESDCYYSGPTSFAVYTLAKCGVTPKDPVIRKGMLWLSNRYRETQIWSESGKPRPKEPEGRDMTTYEVASLIMMLEAVHEGSAKLTGKHDKRRLFTDNPFQAPERSRFPKDDWKWMHRGIVYLTEGKRAGDKGTSFAGCQNPTGGWRYGQANNDQDMSATQFVVLGLRAASHAGYPVKGDVWTKALHFVRSMQNPDGSTPYQKGQAPSTGMSAAAVATAVICKEQLELLRDPKYPVPAWTDEIIRRGLDYVDKLFDPAQNQGFHDGGSYLYYYLYTIERIGDLTGRKSFNGKDWYVRGAEFLLANQGADGAWVDSTCMKPEDTLGTCFALLFLKRATVPVITSSVD